MCPVELILDFSPFQNYAKHTYPLFKMSLAWLQNLGDDEDEKFFFLKIQNGSKRFWDHDICLISKYY